MDHLILNGKLPSGSGSGFPVSLSFVVAMSPLFGSFLLPFLVTLRRFLLSEIYCLKGGVSVRQPYTGAFRYTVSTVSLASPDACPWLRREMLGLGAFC